MTIQKPREKSKTRRVQLELPAKSMARLEALKEVSDAASYAEVIRNALQLYEALINEAEKGNKLFIHDGSDDKVELRPIF